MILSLIIIILMILAFRYGLRRGLVLTMLNFVAYIIVLVISLLFASSLGDFLATFLPNLNSTSTSFLTWTNVNLNQVFYRLLAFWIIAISLGLVFRFVARIINGLFKLPILSQLNSLLGGFLAGLIMYGVIFFALLLLATWPNVEVNNLVNNSYLARFILERTPLFSRELIDSLMTTNF